MNMSIEKAEPAMGASWCLVVPAKLLSQAKSRLAAYAGAWRAELALAFATDTVEAALRSPRVITAYAVTDDVRLGAALSALGARVVPDKPNAGLNAAIEHGASVARSAHPDAGVAALLADTPALRAEELTAVLDVAGEHDLTVVADTQRSGTTLLAAAPGRVLVPRFGERSRMAHVRAGAYEITDSEMGPAGIESLRRDIDTPADLVEALRLGVGPRTLTVAGRLPRLPGQVCRPLAG